jgi:opacity protein-like surface antigen
MKKLKGFFITISIIFLASLNAFAQDDIETKNLQSIDILSGFGWGKLKQKGNYNLIPFSVAFNFNLKNLTKKINFNPRSIVQFQVEPFLSLVTKPDNNLETGVSFWLKMGLLPETSRLQPYFKLGAGLLYMTQHTLEQSTQFNFTEQLAAGFHYSLSKNTSLTLEGRWRHLSNARIKSPNSGINSYFVLTGISYKF